MKGYYHGLNSQQVQNLLATFYHLFEVQYQNSAIGGDPMEVSVFGTAISVRKQQADCFQISPITPNV